MSNSTILVNATESAKTSGWVPPSDWACAVDAKAANATATVSDKSILAKKFIVADSG